MLSLSEKQGYSVMYFFDSLDSLNANRNVDFPY